MRTRLVFPLSLCVLLLLAGAARAADLTPAKVEAFLKTWAELEKISDTMPDDPANEDQEAPGMSGADWAKAIVWDAQMKAVLAKYNYTPEDWTETASRVFGVYTAVKYDEAKVQMDKELAEARAEIEKDDSIPPEQKKEILKNMEQYGQTLGDLAKNRPSAADMAVVTPFVGRMDEMFEAD